MSDNIFSKDDLIQRFAISALSRERKDEAVNEEILAGKYTGEFYIKTKDGVVISTDILNRLANAIENVVDIAESIGMVGDVIKLDFDNIPMPTHVDYNVNLIENEPVDFNGNCRRVLMNLDFDEFDIVNNEPKLISTEDKVKLVFHITLEDGSMRELAVEKSIQIINNFIVDFTNYGNIKSVTLNNITINKDENMFNEDMMDRTLILHNIFTVIHR